jgi:hypothetical protein
LWDSGMTETDSAHVDLYFRQGLLSGTNKVPFLFSGSNMWNVLSFLHDTADADVGEYGTGMLGIQEVRNDTQALTIPYAARYMKCSKEYTETTSNSECSRRFCANCWINRPDIPKEKFLALESKPGGQVKWHPGWREHQLRGRVLAFTLIDAIQDAVQIFSSQTMGGPPLDDSYWHVTEYYNNIRSKILSLGTHGECSKINTDNMLPQRLCTIALNARSAFTPRNKPNETSLSTIIEPYSEDGYIPNNTATMLYEGPDVHNKCYDIPDGAVDVLSIISNRRRTRRLLASWTKKARTKATTQHMLSSLSSSESNVLKKQQQQPSSRQLTVSHDTKNDITLNSRSSDNSGSRIDQHRMLEDDTNAIVPGSGWIYTEEPPGQCDGTYNAICGRAAFTTCPLLGHHDSRGMIQGNEYSGWIVFTLPLVEHGLILVKVVTHATDSNNWKTSDWTSVNNKQPRQRLLMSSSEADDWNSSNNRNTSNYTAKTAAATALLSDIRGAEHYQDKAIHDDRYKHQEEQYIIPNHRSLKDNSKDVTRYSNTTIFEYAIDNKIIKSLTKEELINFIKKPQRVVEIMTLLDDPNFISKTNVQVAIRLRNCGHDCALGISHIYWA